MSDATHAELDNADTRALLTMIASMRADARLLWSDGYQREALGLMERAGRIERHLRRHRRLESDYQINYAVFGRSARPH